MSDKRVAITAPMANRAWCLPYWLGCLTTLDYPRELLSVHIIDDGSTDATPAILKAFRAKYGKTFAAVEIERQPWENPATSARDTQDRGDGYPRLAALRNMALEMAQASGAEYQLSIDADILVSPGLLRGLQAHGLPYVSSMIWNDIESDRNSPPALV